MKIDDLYRGKNNIFQSPVWAEFQGNIGREVVHLDDSYLYKEKLFDGKYYAYAPKSQISNLKSQIQNSKVKKFLSNIVFVRMEPSDNTLLGSHPSDSAKASTDKKGNDPLRPVTKNSILSQQYSPKQTLVLDLTKKEEEILANMKPKHRYNIRLAEKRGVKVKKIDFTDTLKVQAQKHLQGVSDAVDNFYKLSLEVSKRGPSYSPHPKSYYEKMVEMAGKSGNLQIFTAEFEGKALSSLIILFYNETAIYIHGASSNEDREVMPNHLAQWEAIKEAKKRGCKYYDFWGVSLKRAKSSTGSHPTDAGKDPIEDFIVDEGHSWAGVTKFKLGFVKPGITGEIIEFPDAYDLPINKVWYNGLSWLNRLRKLFSR